MKPRPARPEKKNTKPLDARSQDAARLKAEKPRPAWETRQPAQITKEDVEEAKAHPERVRPPGEMGDSQGAAS
jgi:hypothetical protein